MLTNIKHKIDLGDYIPVLVYNMHVCQVFLHAINETCFYYFIYTLCICYLNLENQDGNTT